MKKLFLALAIGVISMTAALAQPSLFIGAGAGVNASKIKFSNGFSNEYIQVYRSFTPNDRIKYASISKFNGFEFGLRAGVHFGESFDLFIEPSFYQRKNNFKTDVTVKEPIEAFIDANDVLNYTSSKSGIRIWDMNINRVQVPILARLKLFGDKFGMNVMAGLSFNFNISATYFTELRIEAEAINLAGNPRWFKKDDNDVTDGTQIVEVSNEYVVEPNSSLDVGNDQFSQIKKLNTSLVLGTGFFYKIDDDGKIKLTLDFRLDLGLSDLYSEKRKSYLNSSDKEVVTIDPQRDTWSLKPIAISGTQKMNASLITIGVEFCPACGF